MRTCKQLKLVEQEMNDLLRKSGISWQEFQAMMPLIITEEEARLSQDGNQIISIIICCFTWSILSATGIYFAGINSWRVQYYTLLSRLETMKCVIVCCSLVHI